MRNFIVYFNVFRLSPSDLSSKTINNHLEIFNLPRFTLEFRMCNKYEHIINYMRSCVDNIDSYLLQLKKLFIKILPMRIKEENELVFLNI